MTLRELFWLNWRHKIQIFVITGLITAGALLLAAVAPQATTTTLLFSAATAEDTATEKAFDATKLANDFASTASGWARSPQFAAKVAGLAGVPVDVTAATQTTQNFLLTLRYADPAASDRVAAAARTVLQEEVTTYNAPAKFKFALTGHGESVATGAPRWLAVGLAALVVGGGLAKLWLLGFFYFSGRVVAASRAAEILGVPVALHFCGPRDTRLTALGLLAEQLGPRAVVIGLDCGLKPLEKHLPEKPAKLELPAAFGQLKAGTPVLAVVRLDHTTEATLHLLRATVPAEQIRLVIWG